MILIIIIIIIIFYYYYYYYYRSNRFYFAIFTLKINLESKARGDSYIRYRGPLNISLCHNAPHTTENAAGLLKIWDRITSRIVGNFKTTDFQL